MDYRIVFTNECLCQLENVIYYLSVSKGNNDAALNVLMDVKTTLGELVYIAESLPFCLEENLRTKGYRKVKLKNYNYLFVYSVKDDVVFIEGFFSTLQNYSEKL